MTARSSAATFEERPPAFSNLAPGRAGETSRWRAIAPYALWGVQVALALLFVFAGGVKFVLSADDLTKDTALSASFLRFIGVCEVLGAVGLVVSALGRSWRVFTPLAAAGLVVIMIGATIVTAVELGVAQAVFPLAVGVLLANVVYARRSWLAAAPRQSTRRKE